jgi:hypothetical protein
MKMDEKKIIRIRKSLLIIFLFATIVGIFASFWNNKAYDKYLDINFSGEVSNIRFCVKGLPYLTINNCEYYISYSYTNSILLDFKSFIQVGDSVVKKEGSSDIYVYRKIGSTYKECLFEKY